MQYDLDYMVWKISESKLKDGIKEQAERSLLKESERFLWFTAYWKGPDPWSYWCIKENPFETAYYVKEKGGWECKQTFPCQNLKDCIKALPNEIKVLLERADSNKLDGIVYKPYKGDLICYDLHGNEVETEGWWKQFVCMRREISKIQETLGLLPGGSEYEQAKSRFVETARNNHI